MQRLGRNKGGYFGERIDIASVLSEIDQLARASGWVSEMFLDWPAAPLNALASEIIRPGPFTLRAYSRFAVPLGEENREREAHAAGRIYISAGIHGDEPAGPLAIRELFRQDAWPSQVDLCVVPCINPTGFQRGIRENYQNVDLNRDYRQAVTEEVKAHIHWLSTQSTFDLALLLHEDWESTGFYVYELNPNNRPSLALAMINAARRICPIECAALVDNWECKHGIISPAVNLEERPQWPEALYLLKTRSRQNYTLESPSDFAMSARVASLCSAVKAGCAEFRLNASEYPR